MLSRCIITVAVLTNLVFANNVYNRHDIIHPVIAKQGMVVTEETLATQIGVDILKQGGNAVDAAAAVAYALAVTLPKAGNLGGGGFMLLYIKEENKVYALDYREKAPKLAHKDLFLDDNGDVDTQKSQHSILSAGVPGTVAGIEAVHKRFGLLPRKAILKPAIKLADKGIPVSYELAQSLKETYPRFSKHPASKAIFYPKHKDFYEEGDTLKQKDLARTLKRLLKYGEQDFYEGDFAQKLVDYSNKQNGIFTLEDMKDYNEAWRNPIKGSYRGHALASMPPPSSGGIALVQALNILESLPTATYGSADSIHLTAEALKYVYRDRAKHLGDSDYVTVPKDQILDEQYLSSIALSLSTTNISNVDDIGIDVPKESEDTTHFVVVDKYGNAITNTYTLNFSYGNAQVVPGTGVILNNEMDDFSSKPGVPNAYGLVGNEKNAIGPEKRMLSSMTPTLVFDKEGDLQIVAGSPGGSRIITTVLQTIRNVVDYDMNVAEAVSAPRFHYQWKPDILFMEHGFSADTVSILKKRGFTIQPVRTMGASEAIVIKKDHLTGAADPRKPNSVAKGH